MFNRKLNAEPDKVIIKVIVYFKDMLIDEA